MIGEDTTVLAEQKGIAVNMIVPDTINYVVDLNHLAEWIKDTEFIMWINYGQQNLMVR